VEQPLATSSPSSSPPPAMAVAVSGAAVDGAAQRAPGGGARAPLPIDDERTLAELRRGHWAAMEELVHRYQDRLFATVLRLVGHPEDADLVQETFVRAMQNVARFEGKSSLYTWLFRIAVNLSLSHRRSRSYRDAVSLDASAEAGEAVNLQAASLKQQLPQETEDDPAALAQVRQEHERIIGAMAELEPDFRAIIVLRDIEDCDYEQIAAILEVPVGTVKSRLFRARLALRELVVRRAKRT